MPGMGMMVAMDVLLFFHTTVRIKCGVVRFQRVTVEILGFV